MSGNENDCESEWSGIELLRNARTFEFSAFHNRIRNPFPRPLLYTSHQNDQRRRQQFQTLGLVVPLFSIGLSLGIEIL